MWLARICSGVEYVASLLLVERLDFLRRRRHAALERCRVDRQILHAALLRQPVGFLVRLEPRLDLRVGRLDVVPELVRP